MKGRRFFAPLPSLLRRMALVAVLALSALSVAVPQAAAQVPIIDITDVWITLDDAPPDAPIGSAQEFDRALISLMTTTPPVPLWYWEIRIRITGTMENYLGDGFDIPFDYEIEPPSPHWIPYPGMLHWEQESFLQPDAVIRANICTSYGELGLSFYQMTYRYDIIAHLYRQDPAPAGDPESPPPPMPPPLLVDTDLWSTPFWVRERVYDGNRLQQLYWTSRPKNPQ